MWPGRSGSLIPCMYLGDGDEHDSQRFQLAVAELREAGWPEDQAVNFLWNDGDFCLLVEAVLDGWRPTHTITHNGHTEYVMLEDGAFYSPVEWVFALPAGWELAGWKVLFQGQVPDGEYTVAPVVYQM